MSSYQDDRYGQGSEEVATGLLQEDPEMYDGGASREDLCPACGVLDSFCICEAPILREGDQCECGNYAERSGFEPCNVRGEDMEPEHGWPGLYRCNECGLIYKAEELQEEPSGEEDDPLCICGTARSEHKLLGCREGFILPSVWARQRVLIAQEALTCPK